MDTIKEHIIMDIDGYPFEIIEEDSGENVYLNVEEKSVLGYMSAGKQAIYLCKKLPYEIKRHTLMHELTHAFLYVRGQYEVEMDNEAVCGLVASLSDRIVELTDNYFELKKDWEKVVR